MVKNEFYDLQQNTSFLQIINMTIENVEKYKKFILNVNTFF